MSERYLCFASVGFPMGRKKRSGEIHLLGHISVICDGMWTHSAGYSKMVFISFAVIRNDGEMTEAVL